MGYFTARERSALGKSVDERAQAKPRDSAHDDFAPRRRPANADIGSLVQQVSDGSVRKIDAVIAELRHRREAILGESTRMCREIIAYAKLNQSTMDSTRVISESLASLAKVPDAPGMSELVDAVSDERDRTGVSEESAESDADAPRPSGTRASMPQTREPLQD